MENQSFNEYMVESRNDFVNIILKHFPHEMGSHFPTKVREKYLEMRVACEDILICFDQMKEKINNYESTIKH
jgi:hypothetical protein